MSATILYKMRGTCYFPLRDIALRSFVARFLLIHYHHHYHHRHQTSLAWLIVKYFHSKKDMQRKKKRKPFFTCDLVSEQQVLRRRFIVLIIKLENNVNVEEKQTFYNLQQAISFYKPGRKLYIFLTHFSLHWQRITESIHSWWKVGW